MPITFHSPAHGDVIMLSEHARHLIKLMGHSDQVPGALDSNNVPVACRRLRQELDRVATADNDADTTDAADAEPEETSEEPTISWHRRAWPLLQMLDAAAEAESHVRWY